MSSKEEAGFPIGKNSDGSFSVNMDGNNVWVGRFGNGGVPMGRQQV